MIDALAADFDGSVGGPVEAADQIQQRGLAGTGRAHQREEFALGHGEVERGEDMDVLGAAVEGFGDVADADEGGIGGAHGFASRTAAPSVRVAGGLRTTFSPAVKPDGEDGFPAGDAADSYRPAFHFAVAQDPDILRPS